MEEFMCSLVDVNEEKINKMQREGELLSVSKEYKRLIRLISDLQWEGTCDNMSFLIQRADYFKKLLDDGQLYEPNF